MPATYTITDLRILSISGSIDPTGLGTLMVTYTRGSKDESGKYEQMKGDQAHTVQIPIERDAGIMGAAQQIISVLATAENLDPTKGDTIE